jgi:hypothetical protein
VKILVACEFSGRVRDAFIAKGHDAVSCDLEKSWSPGPHILGNVLDHLNDGWDLMIAHPPCTYLARSGSRWYWNSQEMEEALDFVDKLMRANIPKVCIENPIGAISTYIKRPTQIVQPWQFGHGETKATCLWLHKLPRLVPTDIVAGRRHKNHNLPDHPLRGAYRSITYKGIAQAMADQWG